jgi:RNA polymerase sigma-70 factor, ECF subfamily
MTAWTETQVTTKLSPQPANAPVRRTGTLSVKRQTGAASAARTDADRAEELFKRDYAKLVGWIRHLVNDDDTAHEIASEAFVRLLSGHIRVDAPVKYLYMIAANLVRDRWRRTQRERRAFGRVAAATAIESVVHPTQDVEVRHLIASLPPRLRDPFLLYYYGGLGIRDVAGLLRRPEGTIKADLFAARATLKTALADAWSA